MKTNANGEIPYAICGNPIKDACQNDITPQLSSYGAEFKCFICSEVPTYRDVILRLAGLDEL